jgi:hypothetical protein
MPRSGRWYWIRNRKPKSWNNKSQICKAKTPTTYSENPLHVPVLAPATFQGLNYLDERSPLAPQLQASPWPNNFRAGTYPKYNSSTDPTQYIMSYQVAVASSEGDDATMAKSFIIALEGTTLTWYTWLMLSGTIIRGTLKTPNSQLVTPISIKLQRPDGYD